jgi:RNA polymerase sigma-70 factor, ECF subfamily
MFGCILPPYTRFMAYDGSFEKLALPHLAEVRRFALRLTADPDESADLVQETFWRALRSWHTYRPDAPCCRWLFAICLNLYRRQWQRGRRVVRLVEDIDWPEPSISGVPHSPDIVPAIAAAARQLSPILRSVFVLVDVEGASYTEAADALGVPIGTIRSRLHRARACLRPPLLPHAADIHLGAA